jgi:phosphoribosylformylglycinamidine synthase subunit PurL
VTQWFKKEGDVVYLLGEIGDSIGGSRYLQIVHGKKTGKCPSLDLGKEAKLHQALRASIGKGLLQSAHDCSDGGFAVALAECCITGATHEKEALGVKASLPGTGRADGRLFGEAQSRAIVSCDPSKSGELEGLLKASGVPWTRIGGVGGKALVLEGILELALGTASELFFGAIEKVMES